MNEGKKLKFVKKVNQITFNSKQAIKNGQIIIFNTDRGVFKIINNKITLIEVAPGIRIKQDIIDKISFPIKVSKKLKRIASKIYLNKNFGLKKLI